MTPKPFYYTKKEAQAFKKADKLICQVSDEWVYLTDGYALLRILAYDWEISFQPVLHREPGDWMIINGKKQQKDVDLSKMFDRFVEEFAHADNTLARYSGLLVEHAGYNLLRTLYAKDRDVCTWVDDKYLQGVCLDIVDLHIVNHVKPILLRGGEYDIGIILPVRVPERLYKVARAFYILSEGVD